MMRIFVVGLVILAVFPGDTREWGNDGHRIVCEIAWHDLTPATKRAVRALLPSGDYDRLSEACTWADRAARRNRSFEWLQPLHYIDVPVDAERVRLDEKNCPRGGCVIEAIDRFGRQLNDPAVSRAGRIDALRLVGHFVGDIHQPLHVSHRDDCGGCSVKPTYRGESGRTMHQIWDSDIIANRIAGDRGGKRGAGSREGDRGAGDRTPGSWWEYADELRRSLTSEDRQRWSASLRPIEWADESLAIARSDVFSYTNDDTIPHDYDEKAIGVIDARLKQAGVRLAVLLDQIFSGRPIRPQATRPAAAPEPGRETGG